MYVYTEESPIGSAPVGFVSSYLLAWQFDENAMKE